MDRSLPCRAFQKDRARTHSPSRAPPGPVPPLPGVMSAPRRAGYLSVPDLPWAVATVTNHLILDTLFLLF